MKYLRKKNEFKIQLSIILLIIFIVLESCNSYKSIPYFQNISDSLYNSTDSLQMTKFEDPKIKFRDILKVDINSLAQNVSAGSAFQEVMNTTALNPSTGQIGSSNLSGYLVDGNGMIDLPVIGLVKVSGLTTYQARDTIKILASQFFKSPVVNVRLSNFTVTILGEVNRPAQYIIPGEKVSILEALGLAGDLTIYAKRNNILLIREEENIKRFIRFDLNSSDLIKNPYYFLRPGDIIYVEPGKSKAAANDLAKTRNISVAVGIVSLLVVIFSRINF